MMIAARNAFLMSGGSKPWTNPYITDGLIAMWDGEWNAGGGVHDANATTWKDLAGFDDLGDFTSEVEFGDKWLRTKTGAYRCAHSSSFHPNANSIELVIRRTHNIGPIVIAAFDQQYRWFGIRGNGTFNFATGGACAQADTTGAAFCHYAGTISNNAWTLYRSGDPVQSLGSGMTWTMAVDSGVWLNVLSSYSPPAQCDIACIRLYSRALTAAEVAANYAKDAARFGP